jgi:hypothetical protein
MFQLPILMFFFLEHVNPFRKNIKAFMASGKREMKDHNQEEIIAALLGKLLSGEEISPEETDAIEHEKELREALKTAHFLKYSFSSPELSPFFAEVQKQELIHKATRQYAKRNLWKRLDFRTLSHDIGFSWKAASAALALLLCIMSAFFFMKGNEKHKTLASYHQLYQTVKMQNTLDSLDRRQTLRYLETIYDQEEQKETELFWHSMIGDIENQVLLEQGIISEPETNNSPLPDEAAGGLFLRT